MMLPAWLPLAMDARTEGWTWWLTLVALLVLALLALVLLRRLLVRPMRHDPTDTTDSWAEAGRRLRVEPPKGGNGDAEAEADDKGPP